MKKKTAIALHKDELDSFGISIKSVQAFKESVKIAHRDDHYMFILQQQGMLGLEIDFSEVRLKGASLCFVTPGQVHRYVKQQDNKGWFIFADVSLVPEQYREIFDAYEHVRQVVAADADDVVFKSVPILGQLLTGEQSVLTAAIVASQVSAMLGIIASKIIQPQTPEHTINGQRYHIVNRFKQLVRNNYKAVKQVQQYAAQLNITPLYLNEVVKEITGFPASHWIRQEILLEAKRLLYHSMLDVKEIAYELGYEDHAYFSRFFKKNTGITALAFRTKNH
ncbi:MAG TPA: helix-turn-helix domain-containing protein [Chitinophaga sp.]|uniref:helix-turn-helix domain-containing protein n=1 Tax=Chitinophaga sp. TaxID=1869181 RepID=UPI002DBB76E3|nr:helix-turn-helix domain-containing protein [Chitinophaga sp.]HEU4551305.1 helix-turn-helix domain-containing protein [Chitinophaga sp.]